MVYYGRGADLRQLLEANGAVLCSLVDELIEVLGEKKENGEMSQCPECGGKAVQRSGACWKCLNCGATDGCS